MMWLALMLRLDYRKEFITAMEYAAQQEDSFKMVTVFWPAVLFGTMPEFHRPHLLEFVTEIAQALQNVSTNIEHVTVGILYGDQILSLWMALWLTFWGMYLTLK